MIAFAIFVVLQGLDAYTTIRILGAGGREMNPVMRWVFARLGVAAGLAAAKVLLVVVMFVLFPLIPVWVAWLIVLGYAAVVGWNATQMR